MKKVGFIGLGFMGRGMAGQLLEKDFELVVKKAKMAGTFRLLTSGIR
jgi:3-hydroxyisobutyrate dehydrogenase-like beta-hydroxyacid dehydrogenase